LSGRRRYGQDSKAARRVPLASEPDQAVAEPDSASNLPGLMLNLQSTIGNAAVTRLVQGGALAPVMRWHEPGLASPDHDGGFAAGGAGGRRLPPETAAAMGAYFGADFSGVRVHTDAHADSLSRSIEATAFTLGNDIFFSNGSYAPDQPQGRELLAHELTHVVQRAPGAFGGQTRISRPDEPAEIEAREIGRAAAAWVSSGGAAAGPLVHRPGARTDAIHRAPAAGAGMSEEQKAKLIDAAVDQATESGGKAKDRAAIAADLEESDTDAETWFADIVPDATFLGIRIAKSGGKVPGVHKELYDVLQQAEAELMSRYPDMTPKEVAKAVGVYSIVGLRPPKKATGGSHPSMHCFGMAIDINYRGNPFVGQKSDSAVVGATERATLLINGTAVNIRKAPKGLRKGETDDSEEARAARAERAGRMWDRLHRASDALQAYLNLSDDDLAALVEADGHGHDIGWWRQRLAEDKTLSGNAEFSNHSDPAKAGFMDLSRELVEVLVGAGLSWGGCYATGKDIMHFDLRTGTIQGRDVL
jgi:Domain of unknown function (DUF4157)